MGRENWLLNVGLGQALHANDKPQKGIKTLEDAKEFAPEWAISIIDEIIAGL